mmetsp:Transcript_21450/g.38338  ORF Transcript_21450/g.38338 Transcript_21450/m.38338 type:complete len:91 (-) Transcript_21450:2-274(-)
MKFGSHNESLQLTKKVVGKTDVLKDNAYKIPLWILIRCKSNVVCLQESETPHRYGFPLHSINVVYPFSPATNCHSAILRWKDPNHLLETF